MRIKYKAKQSFNIFSMIVTIIAKIHNIIWPWKTPKKWTCGVRLKENCSDRAISSYYQEVEYNQVDELIKYHLIDIDIPKGACLDIGCGVGGMTYGLASTGRWFPNIGLDIDKLRIECAKYFAKVNNYNRDCNFVLGDGKRLPFKNTSISLVFGIAILEHIYQRRRLLKEVIRVLKDRGIAVFLFPSFLSPQFRHLSTIIKIPWVHLLFGEMMTVAVAQEILRLNSESSVTLKRIDYRSPNAPIHPISVFGFIKELMQFDRITLKKLYFKRYFKFLPLLNYLPFLTDIFSDYVLLVLKKDKEKQISWSNVAYCWSKSIQSQIKKWMNRSGKNQNN